MNPSLKIILTAIIALAAGLSIACWSPDPATSAELTATKTQATAEAASSELPPPDHGSKLTQTAPTLPSVPNHAAPEDRPLEDQRWCQAWALDNLEPHVYAEFAKLDTEMMGDLDRTVWRARLKDNNPKRGNYPDGLPTYDHGQSKPRSMEWSDMVGTCRMYWSEPLNETNDDRRNIQFEAECKRNLMNLADSEWDDLASDAVRNEHHAAYEIPNQYVQVPKWLNISGGELLAMADPPYELLVLQRRV